MDANCQRLLLVATTWILTQYFNFSEIIVSNILDIKRNVSKNAMVL